MKTKKNFALRALLILVSTLFLVGGCKKDKPEGASTTQTQEPNTTQVVE